MSTRSWQDTMSRLIHLAIIIYCVCGHWQAGSMAVTKIEPRYCTAPLSEQRHPMCYYGYNGATKLHHSYTVHERCHWAQGKFDCSGNYVGPRSTGTCPTQGGSTAELFGLVLTFLIFSMVAAAVCTIFAQHNLTQLHLRWCFHLHMYLLQGGYHCDTTDMCRVLSPASWWFVACYCHQTSSTCTIFDSIATFWQFHKSMDPFYAVDDKLNCFGRRDGVYPPKRPKRSVQRRIRTSRATADASITGMVTMVL